MARSSFAGTVAALIRVCFWPVVLFWTVLIWLYWRIKHVIRPSSLEIDRLEGELKSASTYEAWLETAQRLNDLHPGIAEWKQDPRGKYLKHEFLEARTNLVLQTFDTGDDVLFGNILAEGTPRSAAGIDQPKWYENSYTGTKQVIERYIQTMIDRVERFAQDNGSDIDGDDRQWRANQLSSSITSLGRSVLVLHGGGLFALSHFGVVRGMLERGLLPSVIFGTTTGAWMAAIVGVLTDDELTAYLRDLDQSLDTIVKRLNEGGQALDPRLDWSTIFSIRKSGFSKEPYDEERDIFAQCVMDVVGPTITLEEAYKRSGRILNIEIASDAPSTPNLLNYVTTPNVTVLSAALASQIDDYDRAPSYILEKSFKGDIQAWSLNDETPDFRVKRRKYSRTKGTAFMTLAGQRDDPLRRMAQIFGTRNYVMSQPRPYIFPFLRHSYWNRVQQPKLFPGWQSYLRRVSDSQARLRLRQFARLKDVPFREQQLMLDDRATGIIMTLAPDAEFKDLDNLICEPSKEALKKWILAGERSVWECHTALFVRMGIEKALHGHRELIKNHETR